jgi:NAD(P)-dependent dehydrogenase (short-subunit alcohol dehydrogenase family)
MSGPGNGKKQQGCVLEGRQLTRWRLSVSAGMHGRAVPVTGAASGIGRVTARHFAREGGRIIVAADADMEGAEETEDPMRKAGGEAHFVQCDVPREEDVEAMVAKAVDVYGSLDCA